MLPGLVPNLQRLILTAPPSCLVAEQNLGCLQQLTELRLLHLVIASDGTWQRDTLECLQHLQQLLSLKVDVRGLRNRPLLLPPSLGTLTRLKCLVLRRGPSAHDCLYNTTNIVEAVSSLTCLANLTFTNVIDEFPAALSGLTNLRSVMLEGTQEEDWPSLSDDDASSASPRGYTQEAVGDIEVTMVTPANWLRTCQTLACLPYLSDICFNDVDLSNISETHWVFSSHLTCLALCDCELTCMPVALVSLTSLRELNIAWNPLLGLPAGPYLERLTRLDLCGPPCSLHELPQALCKSSMLHELDITTSGIAAYNSALKAVLPPECNLDISSDDKYYM